MRINYYSLNIEPILLALFALFLHLPFIDFLLLPEYAIEKEKTSKSQVSEYELYVAWRDFIVCPCPKGNEL